jgi:hypothetical protein
MAKAKAHEGKLKRRRDPMPCDVAASLRSAGLNAGDAHMGMRYRGAH